MSDTHETARAPHKAGESREQLVDELATLEDYWLSVTDAARVTRRQEITIRRWIAVGELPVRRQRMGLNKRTRHVRASDLAKLTPIIDPTATITGDVGNLDLTSIPAQQAQLLTTQQELVQRVVPLEDAVAALVEQRAAERIEQMQEVQALRQEISMGHQAAQAEAEHQQHLRAALHSQLEALQQVVQTLSERVQQEGERHQTDQQDIATSLSDLAAALHRVEETTFAIQAHAEQERQALQQHLHEVTRQQKQYTDALQARLTEQITGAQQEWQQRVAHLESSVAVLRVTAKAKREQRTRFREQGRRVSASR